MQHEESKADYPQQPSYSTLLSPSFAFSTSRCVYRLLPISTTAATPDTALSFRTLLPEPSTSFLFLRSNSWGLVGKARGEEGGRGWRRRGRQPQHRSERNRISWLHLLPSKAIKYMYVHKYPQLTDIHPTTVHSIIVASAYLPCHARLDTVDRSQH